MMLILCLTLFVYSNHILNTAFCPSFPCRAADAATIHRLLLLRKEAIRTCTNFIITMILRRKRILLRHSVHVLNLLLRDSRIIYIVI
jgi:hypothetical protein